MSGPAAHSAVPAVFGVLWVAVYAAAGYAGLAVLTFPGTWLALIWLPSGIGLAAVWSRGLSGGLPLVGMGSLLVNAGGILAQRPDAVPLPMAFLLVIAVAGIDMVQTGLAARLWGCFRRESAGMPGSGSAGRGESHVAIWSLPVFGRFVLAVVLAPLLTCWSLVTLSHGFGFAAGVGGGWPVILQESLMLSLSDSLGMILVAPLLITALWAAGRGSLFSGGHDIASAIGLGFLALVPVALAVEMPSALILLVPALALSLLRYRMLGVAAGVVLSGLMILVLAAEQVGPFAVGDGAAGFARIGLMAAVGALTVLMLGVACEQMHSERQVLADRVALRTHELSEALAVAERLGHVDLLTGLGNRRALQLCLEHEIAVLGRRIPAEATAGATAADSGEAGGALSLLVLDIDRFRALNDTHGPVVGDRALVGVAQALSGICRTTDTLFRSGGGEFSIVCRSTPQQGAAVLARKVMDIVAALSVPVKEAASPTGLPPFLEGLVAGAGRSSASGGEDLPEDQAVRLSVCCGIAVARPGEDWEKWQRRADEALHLAKSEGRGRVRAG